MDALLSEEELLVSDTITRQVERLIPTGVRELEAFDDADFWNRRLVEGGFVGLGVPEPYGAGGSVLNSAIAATALGRALAPVPYLGCAVLPLHLLALAGTDPRMAESICNGEQRVGVALSSDGSALAHVGAEGMAWDVSGAERALALDEDGALVLVQLGDPSRGMDLTRVMRPVTYDNIGRVGGHLDALAMGRWTAIALVVLAADTVGVMEGALRLGLEHATSRVQFGVPIGSIQAVQHMLADAHVDNEGARSLVQYAAWAIDNLEPWEALQAARTAKAYSAERGRAVVETVIQVHGGMGMTWDCPAHLYQRRAMSNRSILGDELIHYRGITAATGTRSENGLQ